jgi:hypothetical protein
MRIFSVNSHSEKSHLALKYRLSTSKFQLINEILTVSINRDKTTRKWCRKYKTTPDFSDKKDTDTDPDTTRSKKSYMKITASNINPNRACALYHTSKSIVCTQSYLQMHSSGVFSQAIERSVRPKRKPNNEKQKNESESRRDLL